MRSRTERFLWIMAILTLGAYAGSVMQSSLYQSYANWSFVRILNGHPTQRFALYLLGRSDPPAHVIGGNLGMPLATMPWIGRLDIPRIDLSVIVSEDAGKKSLSRGVGHIEGTPLPGGPGNAGLAGHRDTYFRRLGEVKVGDPIRIVTLKQTHEYVVDAIRIVASDANEVLRDTGHPSLTLVTCYPFWVLGPAPRRYIVHAKLLGTSE